MAEDTVPDDSDIGDNFNYPDYEGSENNNNETWQGIP